MDVVELRAAGAEALRALLLPVSGVDELLLSEGDPLAAFALLRSVVRGADGAPLEVDELDVCQADRLLAALYERLYGDLAECRARCAGCGEDYGATLSLSQLVAAQDADRPPPEPDGTWLLPDGRRVRAPRVEDVLSASTPEAMRERVVLQGDPAEDGEQVDALLDRAVPVLALDLDVTCPHCATPQAVRFDLARYLAARVAGERPFLIREVHLIASHYGWSRAEILALSREDRRAHAGLIEAERPSRARGAA